MENQISSSSILSSCYPQLLSTSWQRHYWCCSSLGKLVFWCSVNEMPLHRFCQCKIWFVKLCCSHYLVCTQKRKIMGRNVSFRINQPDGKKYSCVLTAVNSWSICVFLATLEYHIWKRIYVAMQEECLDLLYFDHPVHSNVSNFLSWICSHLNWLKVCVQTKYHSWRTEKKEMFEVIHNLKRKKDFYSDLIRSWSHWHQFHNFFFFWTWKRMAYSEPNQTWCVNYSQVFFIHI